MQQVIHSARRRRFAKALALLCGTALALSAPAATYSAGNAAAAPIANAIAANEPDPGSPAATNTTKDIGLVGNLFCIANETAADHASLQWATTLSASRFVLYRSTNAQTGFHAIYEGGGTSFTDAAMMLDTTYYYQLMATDGKSVWYSEIQSLTPCLAPSGLNTYDNQSGSSLVYETSGTKVGDTYYSYALRSHAGESDCYLEETTSSDGVHFGNARTVADKSSHADLASCKIESVHIEYMPKTGQIIVWAHWEKPSGYNDGKALVITGTPGGSFTVHHVYNPLDIQVRDMAIFADDDGTGYLIAAANKAGQGANATLYIFKMNESYSDVTEIVTTLFDNQYREFPNLIKHDGYYYLFTSQAAGWYPSSGAYAVTKNLYSGWSDLRSIGNTSTFSSQSGWIVNLGDHKNHLMHAYRWLRAASTSGTTLCPLYFHNGFAFYDYYPSFRYSTKTGDLYPVQQGTLLSQDKEASASIASKDGSTPAQAFDGSYQTAFTAIADYKKWPFNLQVDLGTVCKLGNIQTSWYICKGSEGYYSYTVEGSTDGTDWTPLLDHTDKNSELVSKTYGFNSDMLTGQARYVRLNVLGATLQNNPTNNWYTPTVYEVKIFGTPTGYAPAPKPAANYDFETQTGNQVPDSSGNHRDLQLCGTAACVEDANQGGVLQLNGSDGTYAQLPVGLLDNCRDYTICMDVKSDSAGDFFTFAAGQDDVRYLFFKISKNQFRLAISKDAWQGESGLQVDGIPGGQWNQYALVVSGATAKLYIGGTLAAETTGLTTLLSDLGNSLDCVIGKSFYAADSCFKGEIDNVRLYQTALTQDELRDTIHLNVPGDINADSACNIADVIALQRWLLNDYAQLIDWRAGDLNKDNKLDAMDFCLMKRMLLARHPSTTT